MSLFARSLRISLQVLVAAGISCAFAGSYEDFFSAVAQGNATIVTGWLQKGFDPNARDPNGQPALTLALQDGSTEVVDALLKVPSIDVNALNSHAESALMMAALKGRLEVARTLLKRGATVNLPGWSPLHYAATGPSPELVGLLLAQGAQIDAESPNRTTPLMMASRYGDEASVSLLLAHGANPRLKNDRGLNAADFAHLADRTELEARLRHLAE